MSFSALSIYPDLPPTTNALDSEQRTRLVRSTRKLGAVLGTTPYFLENDTSFAMLPIGKTTSRALKRQGSIFTHHHQPSSSSMSSMTSISTISSHHPSSSVSSFTLPRSPAQSSELLPLNPPGLSTTRKRRGGSKLPPLYLRLNPVPFPLTSDRVPASHSPTSQSTSLPSTPITPTVPDVTEVRRKRMAKLTRHLGEPIPPELVPAPKPSTRCHRRRSQSVHVTRAEVARANDKMLHHRSKQDWVGEWNRPNILDVQKELRNLRVR